MARQGEVIPRRGSERRRKLNKWTAWTNKRVHRNLLFLPRSGIEPGASGNSDIAMTTTPSARTAFMPKLKLLLLFPGGIWNRADGKQVSRKTDHRIDHAPDASYRPECRIEFCALLFTWKKYHVRFLIFGIIPSEAVPWILRIKSFQRNKEFWKSAHKQKSWYFWWARVRAWARARVTCFISPQHRVAYVIFCADESPAARWGRKNNSAY